MAKGRGRGLLAVSMWKKKGGSILNIWHNGGGKAWASVPPGGNEGGGAWKFGFSKTGPLISFE